ncbi:MAG: sensor histidine kinase [bacterium]
MRKNMHLVLLVIIVLCYVAALAFSTVSRNSLTRLLERRDGLHSAALRIEHERAALAMGASGEGLLRAAAEARREINHGIFSHLATLDNTVAADLAAVTTALKPLEIDADGQIERDRSALPARANALSASLQSLSEQLGRHAANQVFSFQSYFMLLTAILVVAGLAVIAAQRELAHRRRAAARRTQLARRLLRSRDTVRRSVAAELHDSIAQELYSAAMAIEQHDLARADSRVRRSLEMIRRLTRALHPVDVTRQGLTETLRGLLDDVGATSRTQFELATHGVDPARLSAETQQEVYEIIREAVSNVVRHAEAKHARVVVTASHPHLTVVIRDDGRGFDPRRRDDGGGIGLTSMEERARALGGDLDITARPGGGVTLRVQIPLRPPPVGTAAAGPPTVGADADAESPVNA